jgi:hypothetical protein
MTQRIDETWHRLLNWTYGSTPSERLAGLVLLDQDYKNFDPTHPLGGPDGGKDALCNKDGKRWIMAVYFPRGQKSFNDIRAKFKHDLEGVAKNGADGIVFVTNQELTESERTKLKDLGGLAAVEVYHLERLAILLDQPRMEKVRQQFLYIDPDQSSAAAEETITVQEPKKPGWVWRCTDESIAAGQISVLAIVEIFIAMAVYWWLVALSHWPWMALIGMVAAPLLLLRSEKSILKGIDLLSRYMDGIEIAISKEKRWFIAMASTLVTCFAVYWLANQWLRGYAGWALFWRAAVLGAGAFPGGLAIFFAVSFSILPKNILTDTFSFARISGSALYSALSVAFFILLLAVVSVALPLLDAIAGMVVGFVLFCVFQVVIIVSFAASIIMRTGYIRLYATLANLSEGIYQLPKNWHETILTIDVFHFTELLPQASTVNGSFSSKELWESQSELVGTQRLAILILLVTLHIPAIAYRWSLKASAWLWFPLILALTPPLHQQDPKKTRKSMAVIHAWHLPYIGMTSLVIVWMFSPLAGLAEWKGILPDWITAIATKLPAPPTFGLNTFIACIAGIFTVLLVVRSRNFKASHGKVLESPNEFRTLDEADKAEFLEDAKQIDRIRLFLIGTVILWGYSLVAGMAYHQYPALAKRFIWPWLLALL